ncbi:response regulator [Candidatus Uabimicrobium sp. HlEnr_7]|uniref:GAF domain-containing hybrid sensor histidine kinase/response regulator n=1 Tax=Candidatus Uabimicrobium helgolandensis TaxID=3095367 RepID=UPI003556DA8E
MSELQSRPELDDPEVYASLIYKRSCLENYKLVDKMFAYLMIFQFLFCVFLAIFISPQTWIGNESTFHIHLWSAIFFGGIFTIFPVFLSVYKPGSIITRHVIGISQVLMSALLIHITGGRIETHFHIFGSLAFLAFYRDWKVLISASVVVAVDHFVRGIYFPQSVFGIITVSNWRWLEHAGWVVFEDLFLLYSCIRSQREMRNIAEKQATYESLNSKLLANEQILQKSSWLKTNLVKLNEEIYTQHDLSAFCNGCLDFLMTHTKALMAAFYHRDQELFSLVATHSFDSKNMPFSFSFGETLLGEAAKKGKILCISANENSLKINTGIGLLTPKSIIYIPICYDEKVHGLIVLATLEDYREQEFLEQAAEKIAIRLENVLSAHKTEILAKTLSEQNKKIQKSSEDLQEKNKQLEEASRHKSEFLANMSHELRTPLNAMIGYTALTVKSLKGKVSDMNIKNLKRAEKSAKGLLKLINDILDFSKIEAGKTQTYCKKMSLADVLKDCLETLEGLAKDKSISLEWVNKDQKLSPIYCDSTKLKQILTNIIGNSVKFTDSGSISILVKEIGESLKVTIADTGCGIPEDTVDSIFESFKQVDSTTKKRFGGTGLGLAITKKFCELLNIDISVESVEGEGTTFHLQIPLWISSKEQESESKQSLKHTPKPIEKIKRKSFSHVEVEKDFVTKKRVHIPCIVSPESFSSLQKHLKDLPFHLEICDLERCLSNDGLWAIVVEPKLFGLEALKTLQEHPKTKHVPVIVYSAKDDTPNFCAQIQHWISSDNEDEILDAFIKANNHQRGDILIVEDHRDTAEMYKKTLEEAQFKCLIADNGAKALELITEYNNFQLILLDLLLPEMDGFEFLAKLQEDTYLRKIPIIIVTGKELSEKEKDEIKEGSELLLNKGDFEYSDFEIYIQDIVQTFRLARSRSVLVVDDNIENLDLIASLLKISGYSVSKTNSGKNIVEKVVKENPAIVLMDLAMPEVDGFEATRKIKENPSTVDTTVIACSAFHTSDFRQKAFEAGCEGYITKPIDPDELIEQIQKYTLASKIARV